MTDELATRREAQLVSQPEFMQEDGRDGMEQLRNYITPPRIKVIQKTSGDAYKDFNTGDIVLLPEKTLIASITLNPQNGKPSDTGQPFVFIPIFFYPEWCLWNPIKLRGTAPSIVERTFDPRNEIAHRARTRDLRIRKHPEHPQLEQRYVEHLNFVVMLPYVTGLSEPAILSFSRGEHTQGTNLANKLAQRKGSIYGCVFEGISTFRKNEQGDWYGINVENPTTVDPFVQDQKLYLHYRDLHATMKEAHEKNILNAQYDDPDDSTGLSDVNVEM